MLCQNFYASADALKNIFIFSSLIHFMELLYESSFRTETVSPVLFVLAVPFDFVGTVLNCGRFECRRLIDELLMRSEQFFVRGLFFVLRYLIIDILSLWYYVQVDIFQSLPLLVVHIGMAQMQFCDCFLLCLKRAKKWSRYVVAEIEFRAEYISFALFVRINALRVKQRALFHVWFQWWGYFTVMTRGLS